MNFTNPNLSVLSDKKLYIFDMDGTIYLGNQVFPFAIRFIKNLRAAGKRVLFFTNNASHSPDFHLKKLTRLGFEPTMDEIMTSGDVTIEFLRCHRAGKSVYLVGTDELVENFREKGIDLLTGDEKRADIVITSFDRSEMCIFGDRLYTDIAIGKRHGVTAVLVLSGETQPADVEAAEEKDKPDFVFDSLDNVDHAMFGE